MVASIGLPAIIYVMYLGGWGLGALMGFSAAMSSYEYFGLASARGVKPIGALGTPLAVLFVLMATLDPTYAGYVHLLGPVALGALLVVMAVTTFARGPQGSPLSAAAVTVTGALYTGGALGFALLLRHLPESLSAGATAADGMAVLGFPVCASWGVGRSCCCS